VVLLMPFLATDWSSTRQRLLRLASRAAPLLGLGAGVAASLPAWLQRRLVALTQPLAEGHARDSMLQLVDRSAVHNAFHLAQHEFRCGA
jgi:hypothetical protein